MAVCVVAVSLMFAAMSYADADNQATDAISDDIEATVENVDSSNYTDLVDKDVATTDDDKKVTDEKDTIEDTASDAALTDPNDPANYQGVVSINVKVEEGNPAKRETYQLLSNGEAMANN